MAEEKKNVKIMTGNPDVATPEDTAIEADISKASKARMESSKLPQDTTPPAANVAVTSGRARSASNPNAAANTAKVSAKVKNTATTDSCCGGH